MMNSVKGTVALLKKGDNFGVIALDNGVMSNFDTRTGGSVSPQTSPDGGQRKFSNSVATSRSNGWSLFHFGERNFG